MNGLQCIFLIWSVLAASTPAVLPSLFGAPGSSLDKTWTTAGPEKTSGSQALTDSVLASRVSFAAEGMGLN